MIKLFFVSTLFLCSLLIYSYGEVKKGLDSDPSIEKLNRIDTLYVSDSVYQIVKWEDGIIRNVKMIDAKGVMAQNIQFYENGIISFINMTLDIRWEKEGDFEIANYQINQLKLNEKGELVDCIFVKDFETVLKYSSFENQKSGRK